ncbi:Pyridoxal phosphate-dependent transferases superfamily protein [Hibiscus syriacus]|uniref:Pyridoxal phosphate-dependent transferases superfamily protein n=1 Tax=Hibiscus syriacus TaxID=106335 RepID=A0A6A3A708_HIBSY|nr:glucuronoxylan 4-O-methyltransferase 1-like [Hibiscus syriacus]KAE8699938.1 Pyridoxal phosphate-dependent transferases superfamily protein [Hibiscus syriacus]
MPPQVSNGGASQIGPSVQLCNGSGLRSSPKHGGTATRRMKYHGKKLLPVLVLILSCLSILRLLKIAMIASHSSSSFQSNAPSTVALEADRRVKTSTASALTPKEFMLLSKIITRKAPCNLLVFGHHSQYFDLSSINARGITVFLDDDPRKKIEIKADSNGTRVYNVEYRTPAKEAYDLLKHARGNPACSPAVNLINQSSCKLALRNLPEEIYKLKWDLVVVDGPTGDSPDAQGRMSTINTAGMLARGTGETTDVVVHDVDRTIEKWFSWEFLCQQNLVSAKGKLWDFRIAADQSNSTSFCSSETLHVMP